MKIPPFALERYYAKHEFTAKYMLSSSDCESLSLSELLAMADEQTQYLWDELHLGYTDTSGHPQLRQSIASNLYTDITSEHIQVVVPEEGIFLLMHALLSPGDHVVCTFPGYQSLYEIARSIGCQVSFWDPTEERGWLFDVEKLKDLLQPNTRLVVVNFPHNPTGALPTLSEFEQLIELIRKQGCYLLSDEIYRYLEVEEGTTLPAACEQYERAIVLGGLSKSFGLPGLRMGWLATREQEILQKVAGLKDYTTICHTAPSEILSIIAINNYAEITSRQRQRVGRNLENLDQFFKEYTQYFRWERPKGSSVCFPRLLNTNSAATFCDTLMNTTGIMLVPASMFQYGDQHVRIGYGRENLPEVLTLFSAYLDDLND